MFYFWGNVPDHWTPSSFTAVWSPWIFVRFIFYSLGYSPWCHKELDMAEWLTNSGTHVSYQGLHLVRPILAHLIQLTCHQYSGIMWCVVKCPDDPEDLFVLYYDWGCRVNIALKVKVLVIQLCLTLCDPLDCSPPGSSVHGILQARILEWVVIHFSRGSSQPREDQTWVSHIAGRFFTIWATREATNIALGEIKCVWLSIWHEYELLLILFPFLKTRYIYPLMHLFIFGYAGSWLWHVGSFFSFVVGHCLLFSFSPGA